MTLLTITSIDIVCKVAKHVAPQTVESTRLCELEGVSRHLPPPFAITGNREKPSIFSNRLSPSRLRRKPGLRGPVRLTVGSPCQGSCRRSRLRGSHPMVSRLGVVSPPVSFADSPLVRGGRNTTAVCFTATAPQSRTRPARHPAGSPVGSHVAYKQLRCLLHGNVQETIQLRQMQNGPSVCHVSNSSTSSPPFSSRYYAVRSGSGDARRNGAEANKVWRNSNTDFK